MSVVYPLLSTYGTSNTSQSTHFLDPSDAHVTNFIISSKSILPSIVGKTYFLKQLLTIRYYLTGGLLFLSCPRLGQSPKLSWFPDNIHLSSVPSFSIHWLNRFASWREGPQVHVTDSPTWAEPIEINMWNISVLNDSICASQTYCNSHCTCNSYCTSYQKTHCTFYITISLISRVLYMMTWITLMPKIWSVANSLSSIGSQSQIKLEWFNCLLPLQ